jgi:hypothetical protein
MLGLVVWIASDRPQLQLLLDRLRYRETCFVAKIEAKDVISEFAPVFGVFGRENSIVEQKLLRSISSEQKDKFKNVGSL